MLLSKPADNTRHCGKKRHLFSAFTKIKVSLLKSYICERHFRERYILAKEGRWQNHHVVSTCRDTLNQRWFLVEFAN